MQSGWWPSKKRTWDAQTPVASSAEGRRGRTQPEDKHLQAKERGFQPCGPGRAAGLLSQASQRTQEPSSRWWLPRTFSKPHSWWDSRVLLFLINWDHSWLSHPAKEISKALAVRTGDSWSFFLLLTQSVLDPSSFLSLSDANLMFSRGCFPLRFSVPGLVGC